MKKGSAQGLKIRKPGYDLKVTFFSWDRVRKQLNAINLQR